MLNEASKTLPNHHRVGSAGCGMNGERAPGPALSYVEGSALSYVEGSALSYVEGFALSYVEGVNRQTAGNLARQRRPQSGAVCKVQCDSNPNRRMIALLNPPEAKRQKHCALQDLA